MSYNGWSTREAWTVNLHLTNDPVTQAAAQAQPTPTYLEAFVRELIEGEGDEEMSLFQRDLVNNALGHVDFDEIFKALHE